MGRSNRLWLEQQEKEAVPIQILGRSGVYRPCVRCGEMTADALLPDLTPAYRLANHLITRKDPLVAPFHGNRRELSDRIKEAHTDLTGVDCTCALDALDVGLQ